MGFFGGKKKKEAAKEEEKLPPPQPSKPALQSPAVAAPPKADVNAVLKAETSVFEFGSAATGSDDGVTLAGYCPVSDDMEPCRWEILPSGGAKRPNSESSSDMGSRRELGIPSPSVFVKTLKF